MDDHEGIGGNRILIKQNDIQWNRREQWILSRLKTSPHSFQRVKGPLQKLTCKNKIKKESATVHVSAS